MYYKFSELCEKEVVNCSNGTIIGNISDVEISTEDCTVTAIFIDCSKGLFSRSEEIRIPWDKIEKIGNDLIIVNFCHNPCKDKHPEKSCKKHFFK